MNALRLVLLITFIALAGLGCTDDRKTCRQLGWSCGIDDYNQLCGSCFGSQSCDHGTCSTPITQITSMGNCGARVCGGDGYGHSCGTCGALGVCMPAGYCGTPPVSLWRVTVTSGIVAERDGSGAAWDPLGGLPDPFVCLSAGSNTKCTRSARDTLMPTWNEQLLVVSADVLQSGLSMQYWDADLDANDGICWGVFPVGPQDLARGSVRLGWPPGGPSSVEVQFAPQGSW
jgi:hypothetical protein